MILAFHLAYSVRDLDETQAFLKAYKRHASPLDTYPCLR